MLIRPYPLARLRAQAQLVEVRAVDLCFTADEAERLSQRCHGAGDRTGPVAALERRTEGWIAGLQLAALSLHNRKILPDLSRLSLAAIALLWIT